MKLTATVFCVLVGFVATGLSATARVHIVPLVVFASERDDGQARYPLEVTTVERGDPVVKM